MKASETISQEISEKLKRGEISQKRVDEYYKLLERVKREILPHEVITNNQFCAWFEKGQVDREDVRHFLIQFSVFSNLFIEAQLKKTINAPTLEAMHASKQILMNELGVVFKPTKKKTQEDVSSDVEQDIVQDEGTVDGGTFFFKAAHFEWMLRMISHVGLTFNDVGKRRHGTPSTLFFCDELSRIYGSEDTHVALGASFAVENWAAAGFWKELISGLHAFKERECPQLPLAFFTWHNKVEDQHAAHTWDELEETFFSMDLDQDKFIQAGKEMLNGVNAFWKGLDQDRKKREASRRIAG
jgi:pyrroloquinoline quinone (PQQ) biosynthesis protein C